MTHLMQRAIDELKKLPDEAQDALATRILEDLEDEQEWSRRFEATTPEQWARMADLAKREIAAGETTPLEDVFPLRESED